MIILIKILNYKISWLFVLKVYEFPSFSLFFKFTLKNVYLRFSDRCEITGFHHPTQCFNITLFSGSRYPDFIKFGHLMDAVGASNPNNNLEFQQILLRPRNLRPPKSPNLIGSRLGDVLVGSSINRRKNDILGETLNTLREVREAFGVNTLRDFFMHLRKMLQTVLNRDVMIQNVPRGNERKLKLPSRNGGELKCLKL